MDNCMQKFINGVGGKISGQMGEQPGRTQRHDHRHACVFQKINWSRVQKAAILLEFQACVFCVAAVMNTYMRDNMPYFCAL